MNSQSQMVSYPPRSRRHPVTGGEAVGMLAGLGLLSLGVYGVGKLFASHSPLAAKPMPTPGAGEHELSGVYVPGATLAASPKISAAVRLPIVLSTYSITDGDGGEAPVLGQFPQAARAEYLVLRSKRGDMVPLEYIVAEQDGMVTVKVDELALVRAGIGYDVSDDIDYTVAAEGPQGAVATVLKLVSNLAGPVADSAYETALQLAANNYSFAEPSMERDAFVSQVLKTVAPNVAWPASPEPLAVGTPRWQTWMGVDLVGLIAYASHYNSMMLA